MKHDIANMQGEYKYVFKCFIPLKKDNCLFNINFYFSLSD